MGLKHKHLIQMRGVSKSKFQIACHSGEQLSGGFAMQVRHRNSASLVVTIFLPLLLLSLSTIPVFAQSTSTGTLGGTVTDTSGTVVSGATVSLTDAATKTTRTATTNGQGRYIFVDVTPGSYDLNFAKQGFSTSKTQTTVSIG